jgi:hypothetical protein
MAGESRGGDVGGGPVGPPFLYQFYISGTGLWPVGKIFHKHRREAGHIRHGPLSPGLGGRVGVRVWGAEVGEPREEVRVWLKPVGRDLAF